PRNFRVLAKPSHRAEGQNPLCGDELTVYIELEGDRIRDIGFQGQGCAISKASASMMTGAVKGKTLAEAEALFEGVHDMVTKEGDIDAERLGKLAVFSGVREFPVRVKCASLPWHTLRAALRGEAQPVSTE